MEYLPTTLAFLTGGGATAIVSLRYIKKTSKLDYADRAMKFMEDQNIRLVSRIDLMDKRIDALELISCHKTDCKNRMIL